MRSARTASWSGRWIMRRTPSHTRISPASPASASSPPASRSAWTQKSTQTARIWTDGEKPSRTRSDQSPPSSPHSTPQHLQPRTPATSPTSTSMTSSQPTNRQRWIGRTGWNRSPSESSPSLLIFNPRRFKRGKLKSSHH